MAGGRRPMALNLSVANGGKHWTKKEIQERQAQELALAKPKALAPPTWLSKPGKALFRKYAKQLLEFPAGTISPLDTGTLARYCDSELAYADASTHREAWMSVCRERLMDLIHTCHAAGDAAYSEARAQVDAWSGLMAKYEKICRGCAAEMGLTVSSRCRLVVPKSAQPQEEDPLEALRQKFLSG